MANKKEKKLSPEAKRALAEAEERRKKNKYIDKQKKQRTNGAAK